MGRITSGETGISPAMQPWIRYVLRTRRIAAGLTLRDLDIAGVATQGQLSRYENGKNPVPDSVVDGYALVLGTSALALYSEALELWKRDPKGIGLRASSRGSAARKRRLPPPPA